MVERNGHEGTVNVGENLVLIVGPLGKARKEVVDALVVRVIDVRTVLVNENTRLVLEVVCIARDMVAALEHRHAESSGLGEAACANGACIAGAHDNHVISSRIELLGKTRGNLHRYSLNEVPATNVSRLFG